MEYEMVIGLEVHAELSTKTKIYCSCTTKFGGRPNTHVCPVCMGLPGSLPHLNKKVVEYAIKAGLTLNCSITKLGRMDRKSIFYPDCPKNYQITQDELPICTDGLIEIESDNGNKKKIRIDRIHIEEDAAKLMHTDAGTMVDFNRSGVPLIEIVSKPDLRSSKEAVQYLEKLKSILSCIGVSDCKMEEGSLRCDANISVMRKDSNNFGIRCEIKNMNSFKALEKAIDYEATRHINIIELGKPLIQETRRWDDTKNITIVMRSKEFANDYRYFPEGDLVTLNIDDNWIEDIKKSIPELPYEKEKRFIEQFNIPKYDAGVLTLTMPMADFFEKAAKMSNDAKSTSNWLMGDISKIMKENNVWIEALKFAPEQLAELIKLINNGTISNAIAKKVVVEMFNTGKWPKTIIEEKELIQNSDKNSILKIVKEILDNNTKSIKDYNNGKTKVIGFLVGMVMKETRGKANPQIVNKLINEQIKKY